MALALFNSLRNGFRYTPQSFLSRSFTSVRIDPTAKTITNRIERNPAAFGGSSLLSQCWGYFSGLNTTSIRTHIRIHFPKPCERKRVAKHGWKKRMSTPSGKRILMNRILKGRHVLSH